MSESSSRPEIVEPPSFARLCPKCGEVAEFCLVRTPSTKLDGMLGELGGETLSLRCARCADAQPVEKEAVGAFRQAQELYAGMKSGQISQAEFEARLGELGVIESAPVAETPGWTCPKCGETIEAGLLTCWNCGHEITVPGAIEDAPPSPNIDIGGGAFPWESHPNA
jgi:predicted RNA-binding Zn-ribbon protein involved in translation (DUF1610 family)